MAHPVSSVPTAEQGHDAALTLQHVGIGVVMAVIILILLIFISFRRLKDIRKGSSRLVQVGGLTISGSVYKDQHLSSNFVLAAIENGVVMVRRDSVIHLFNPAAAAITGWPPNEAVGMDVHNVIPIVDSRDKPYPPEQHPFTKALVSNGTVRDTSLWLSSREGKRIPISLIVSPILDPEGKPTGSVVGVFSDMTKQKEEETRRSEFISTASHEMRSPLTAIDGYLALALNEKISQVDENARKYLQKAAAATHHLSILFRDLLTSSRAEDGRLESRPTVVELGEIVEQVTDGARLRARDKGLALRYVINTDGKVTGAKVVRPLYYAFVDPHRIREVIQNLIDNAIKYTAEGSITVRLTGNAQIAQIQVQDSGPGIPKEDIPHLFQKFYRVDSSLTRTVGGNGLGLFISQKIVELYRGRIWVESEPGRGSTFFINLPRLTAPQALDTQKRQAATVSPLEDR